MCARRLSGGLTRISRFGVLSAMSLASTTRRWLVLMAAVLVAGVVFTLTKANSVRPATTPAT